MLGMQTQTQYVRPPHACTNSKRAHPPTHINSKICIHNGWSLPWNGIPSGWGCLPCKAILFNPSEAYSYWAFLPSGRLRQTDLPPPPNESNRPQGSLTYWGCSYLEVAEWWCCLRSPTMGLKVMQLHLHPTSSSLTLYSDHGNKSLTSAVLG